MPTVIYDFDGTLGDTLDFSIIAYRNALKHFNIKQTDEEIVKKCFNKFDSVIARSFEIDAHDFSHHYHTEIDRLLLKAKLFHGVKKTLEILGNRAKLGMVSMQFQQSINKMVKITGLQQYFHCVKGNTYPPKKRFELVEDVLLRLKSDKVLMVGDAGSDMEAAQRLGLLKVLFFPKRNEKFYDLEELKKYEPDFIIKKHQDILKIVNG